MRGGGRDKAEHWAGAGQQDRLSALRQAPGVGKIGTQKRGPFCLWYPPGQDWALGGDEWGDLAQGAIKKVGQVFLGLWRNSCYKFIMA